MERVECRYSVGRGGTSTAGMATPDLIKQAREVGVLEPPLAAKLQDMVALKDAILHEFWRLDYQQVYNAAWRELGVLDKFARQIKRRLEVKRRWRIRSVPYPPLACATVVRGWSVRSRMDRECSR